MKSLTTLAFRELLAELPVRVQRHAKQAYRLFQENHSHPGLQFKQVLPNPPTYSVRVGLHHRAIGALREGAIVWYWIGSHADYDKMLERL